MAASALKGAGAKPTLSAYDGLHHSAERHFDVELTVQAAGYTPAPQCLHTTALALSSK